MFIYIWVGNKSFLGVFQHNLDFQVNEGKEKVYSEGQNKYRVKNSNVKKCKCILFFNVYDTIYRPYNKL